MLIVYISGSSVERVLREILSELRDISRATDQSRDLLRNIEGAAWTRN
jgi:hypothetical protein